MVKDRNDELIFENINWLFPINMMLNGMWLIVFGGNNILSFISAAIVIFGILYTNIMIMRHSLRNSVNKAEFISLRIGFSIYSGWVTAATILNVTFIFKSAGWESNEEELTIIILSVAFLIYSLASFMERNPVYGAVFIWVLAAINSEAVFRGYEKVHSSMTYFLLLYTLVLAGISVFCV